MALPSYKVRDQQRQGHDTLEQQSQQAAPSSGKQQSSSNTILLSAIKISTHSEEALIAQITKCKATTDVSEPSGKQKAAVQALQGRVWAWSQTPSYA